MLVVACISLLIASVAALLSSLANNIEKLLWGSVICSLGFGMAVLSSGGKYFAILITIVFLISDVLLYLYLRTIAPAQRSGESTVTKRERFSYILILWLAMCAIAILISGIQSASDGLGLSNMAHPKLDLLEKRVWGDDWIVLFVCFSVSIFMTVGGFFLVRGDKADG